MNHSPAIDEVPRYIEALDNCDEDYERIRNAQQLRVAILLYADRMDAARFTGSPARFFEQADELTVMAQDLLRQGWVASGPHTVYSRPAFEFSKLMSGEQVMRSLATMRRELKDLFGDDYGYDHDIKLFIDDERIELWWGA